MRLSEPENSGSLWRKDSSERNQQTSRSGTYPDRHQQTYDSETPLDAFLFFSISKDTFPIWFSKDSAPTNELEAIGIVGHSSEEGFYTATIFARGIKAGSENNYLALFGGVEVTSTGLKDIIIAEGSAGTKFGAVFSGAFESGALTGKAEKGVFVGVSNKAFLGKHGAAGIGVVLPKFPTVNLPNLGDTLRGLGILPYRLPYTAPRGF